MRKSIVVLLIVAAIVVLLSPGIIGRKRPPAEQPHHHARTRTRVDLTPGKRVPDRLPGVLTRPGGGQTRRQRQPSGIAAHHLDYEDSFVRFGGRMEPVDALGGEADGRGQHEHHQRQQAGGQDLAADLDAAWEVLAEPSQTVMRR